MADTLRIEPLAGPPSATIALPGSKSITNRALITAALATGTTTLRGALFADDTDAMIGALGALGVALHVDEVEGTIEVEGCGGNLPGHPVTVDARQSGTTGRFIAPVVALGVAPIVVDGAAQLRGRPMDDLIDALRSLGVTVTALEEPGRLPLEITGPLTGGHVVIAGDVSSQFASALLLAGGVAGLSVSLSAEAVSRPYLHMTTRVMEAFGASVSDPDGDTWHVGGGYRAVDDYWIEPDASAASYFLAAAAMTGGRVRIEGLGRDSMQGDVAFADVLARMGADVDMGADWLEVRGGPLHGIEVDLRHVSDTAPTLAVVAAVAEGPTTVTGIGFVRGKESDRVAAPVRELERCGVPAEVTDDGFVIRPDGLPTAARVETYDDHRMAMAFALIGLVVPGIEIVDPGCVAKTFPGYFAALEQLRGSRR